MEVIIRSVYSTLSTRLRDSSKKRVNGVDVTRYDDDNASPATRAVAQEEKLSQLRLDVLKSENDTIVSDNRILFILPTMYYVLLIMCLLCTMC